MSLPTLIDPAGMFVYVNKVSIKPERAHTFLKLNKSSGKHANTTYYFSVDENAYKEKTGNVSIFVSIAAFNTNYTLYKTFTSASQKK